MLLTGRDDADSLLLEAESGAVVSVGDVRTRARQIREASGGAGLAFLACDNSVRCVTDFLAVLECGLPVALMDAGLNTGLTSSLTGTYHPEVFLQKDKPDVSGVSQRAPGVWVSPNRGPRSHPHLAVLLTTSGSTGSPKFVRLSRDNIESNARQIAASLRIGRMDRGVTALPVFYSFGMSIITSHVVAGSTVLVTDRGVLDARFWQDLATYDVTFLPGVPATFAMLKRLGFADRELPRLRALIQAGGRLAPELVSHFAAIMKGREGEFFVMYGQTEASPRIACLPPTRVDDKLGSAGVAIQGGSLSAMSEGRILGAGEVGEIVYSGPNVMMGYAQSREDLAAGDVQGDTLRTGDLGYVDDEGFLFLTGRLKRIAKLAGARVSLDEIERMVPHLAPVAVVDAGEAGVTVFTSVDEPDLLHRARRDLARRLQVAGKLVSIRALPQLPVLSNGKVDYRTLTAMAGEKTT